MISPDMTLVYLIEDDTLILHGIKPDSPAFRHAGGESKKVGECLCGLVARAKEPIYAFDIHADPRCTLNECKSIGVRSFAAIPLVADNRIFGVLGLASLKPVDFSGSAHLLEIVASQMSGALHNNMLYQQLQEVIARFEVTEDALQKELSFRTALIELATEGICVCHDIAEYPYVRFSVWNNSMKEITGYSIEEINRCGWYQTVYPEEEVRERAIRRMDTMRQGNDLVDEEWEIVRADGQKRTISISTTVLTTEEKKTHVMALMHDVTERRLAAEELRRSEAKCRVLLDNIPQKVFYKDRNSVYVAVNPCYAKDFGMLPGDFVGKTDYDLYPKELAEMYRTDDQRLMSSGATEELDESYILRGETWSVHTVKTPVYDETGTICGVLGIFWDITKRKYAESEMLRLHRQNQLILDAAEEGIIGLDLAGKITFVNPAAARTLGYSIDELTGKALHQLVHHSKPNGDPYPLSECPMHESLRLGTVSRIRDEVLWKKDGMSFPSAYSSTPIFEDGNVIGAVVTFQDITVHKRGEEALKESEAKFRSYIESAPLAILVADREGRLMDFNPAAIDLLGYDAALLRNMHILDLHPEDHRAEVLRQFATLLETGHVETEIRMKKWDGQIIWVSLHVVMTSDRLSLGYCQDITERRRTEEELRKALREISERSAEMERVNIALQVLLDQREKDKAELEETILSNVNMAVLPELENLKETRLSGDQALCAERLEKSIRRLVSPYIRKLTQNVMHLTPTEIRIAEMIRRGMRTKAIADLLTLSPSTVLSHRESLRDKLGLRGKKLNLAAYLRTFE
jgi:PAS domain S-box-containing protein